MKLKTIFLTVKNLLPYILSIYFLIFGISWIILHAYIRFFLYKQKSSYTLEALKPFITEKHIIFFTMFIVVHVVISILNIIVVYKQMFPQKEYSFYTQISQKISYIVILISWKPLEYIHDLIIPHILMSGEFFVYIEKIWSKKDATYFYALIFLFEILPKTLVALVFLVEVVVFGQVKIFLHILSLILITVFWRIFLKAFSNCGTINLPIIKEYFLNITGIGKPTLDDNGVPSSYPSYEFVLKPEYEDVIIDIEEEALLLMQFEAMPRFVHQIKKDSAKIIPYISFITSIIYVIGSTYCLICLLT